MPKYVWLSPISTTSSVPFSSSPRTPRRSSPQTQPAGSAAFQGMRGSEVEDTSHNFVIRRCYMNPVGREGNSVPYSNFRQSFVRDGWEVIDTPPLTNQGKTSADTHIVMDVLDSVTHYPHVDEYVIMAADADYTPLIIRLRKHMKTTVVYAAMQTSVAYRAACDSLIDERSMLEILEHDDEVIAEASTGIPKRSAHSRKSGRCRRSIFCRMKKKGIGPTWQRLGTCYASSFLGLRTDG